VARRHGDTATNTACGKALEVDVISVSKIASMLERHAMTTPARPARRPAAAGRLARDAAEFATGHGHLWVVGDAGRQPEHRLAMRGDSVKAVKTITDPVRLDLPQIEPLKLGKLTDTLPEQLNLAKSSSWAMPSSLSWCSSTRSPAARPALPRCGSARRPARCWG